MNAKMRLHKARMHIEKAKHLLNDVNEELMRLLEDSQAHITDQPGDGFCVCYNESSDNAIIHFDMDEFLKIKSKEEALEFLDQFGL